MGFLVGKKNDTKTLNSRRREENDVETFADLSNRHVNDAENNSGHRRGLAGGKAVVTKKSMTGIPGA